LFLQFWGLNSGPSPWATPPALFLWRVFWARVSQNYVLGWLWIALLLISASWVARFTDMSHQSMTIIFSGYIVPFINTKWSSLSLLTNFGFISTLSDITISTSVCFQGLICLENLFSHFYHKPMLVFSVRCISYRQQIMGSCFLISSPFYVIWLENWNY
jgi:hypothetical protein